MTSRFYNIHCVFTFIWLSYCYLYKTNLISRCLCYRSMFMLTHSSLIKISVHQLLWWNLLAWDANVYVITYRDQFTSLLNMLAFNIYFTSLGHKPPDQNLLDESTPHTPTAFCNDVLRDQTTYSSIGDYKVYIIK